MIILAEKIKGIISGLKDIGREEGREKGREKGKKDGERKIIKKLLKKLTADEVSNLLDIEKTTLLKILSE